MQRLALCLVLFALASCRAGWGSLQSGPAEDAFIHGGEARRLNGVWDVVWFTTDENGQQVPFKIDDPENPGKKIDYPPEVTTLTSYGAVVSCKTTYSSGDLIDYWYEGRLSAGDDVTLLYWQPAGDETEKLMGVVFLTVNERLNKPLEMTGWWQGRTRDGKVTTGTTRWQKRN